MEKGSDSSSTPVDALRDEAVERMRRVDSLVRPWVDADFRAQINPDIPEVVGPPTKTD